MSFVSTVVTYEVLLFLGILAFVIFYQLLTGKINTRRLLFSKGRARDGAAGFSPSRVQLLIVTVASAIFILSEVLSDPGGFPEVPTWIIAVLVGSEAIYLGRKANNLVLRRRSRT